MAICEMKKLSLAAHIEEIDDIINDLMWLGAVEISPYEEKMASAEWSGLVSRVDVRENLTKIEKQLSSLSAAIDLLKAHDTAKKSIFATKNYLSRTEIDSPGDEYDEALSISNKANEIIKQTNDLKSEENKLEALRASLMPWLDLDIPLSMSSTERSIITLGAIPATQNTVVFRETLNNVAFADITEISRDEYLIYFAILYHADDESVLASALSSCGFTKIIFKDVHATSKEKIAETDGKIVGIKKELEALREKTVQMASNLGKLEKCYDITLAKQIEFQTKQKFLQTDTVALIEGYIPTAKVDKLNSIVEKYNCYAETEDPDLSEENIADVPILLKNNKFADPFETVVGLYSYPIYKTFDPTMIMSIFYFIIFGLMFADFMYGFLLTVGCVSAVKIMKPKRGLKRFLNMFAWCGVATMIVGILFGGYFGNLPASIAENWFGAEPGSVKLAVLFDPLENPMAYLGISLAIGALHLFTGMGIKMYCLIKAGRVFDAIADVGMWYLLLTGLGLAIVTPWGAYVALAGAAGLVLTQGRKEKNIVMKFLKGLLSLYDSVAYISDLLSYSRILALSLAGAVIGMVFNLLGTMANGVFGVIMLIAMIALGHGLNFALNILGSFVHAARLQYIEFFSKFYENGGRVFAPVELEVKYSGIDYGEN